jgi:hypothetical protein
MTFVNNLVQICIEEWEFFQRSRIELDGTSVSGLKEYQDGGWQRVGDYWREIGGPYSNLTGKDRGTPWSAAFISWAMKRAGAGDRFPYSAGHATYINQSIRSLGRADAPLIGHKSTEYAPKVGDLIGYWRGPKKITFENALQTGWYESHTDIVVDVSDNALYSIGGNILHSVTKTASRINKSGLLIDKRQNWFVVIENRISA